MNIIAAAIQVNGDLNSMGSDLDYFTWSKGDRDAVVDGNFTAAQLRAIADHMDGGEETELVKFFRGEGSQYGNNGDLNNWSVARTAIEAMRELTRIKVSAFKAITGFTLES